METPHEHNELMSCIRKAVLNFGKQPEQLKDLVANGAFQDLSEEEVIGCLELAAPAKPYRQPELWSLLIQNGACHIVTEEGRFRCVLAIGLSNAVALLNMSEVWDMLKKAGITITRELAVRAFPIFVKEGAVCSLRRILPLIDDVDTPLIEGYTPFSYALNGSLPVSACWDGFWRIRMNLECAKSLLDHGADLSKVSFMNYRLGMPEREMVEVLQRALLFIEEAPELKEAAGTPNDLELYTLILLLRAKSHPDADPRERSFAQDFLPKIKEWRKDLAPLAARMPALQARLRRGNY